jgi:hypothetical protein
VSLVSYQISGAFPASDRPAFEELSQRLLGRDEECGEDMWRLCKKLNGTESLNERDYFVYDEIVGVNLWHVKKIG